RSGSGRGVSPDSFFPSFRPAVGEINRRGNGKVCFMKTKASGRTNSKNRSSRACGTVPAVLLTLVLVCFALSPTARAVDPPPDGGYPGFNTAEGTDALFSLTDGINNTATGFDALFNNTTGSYNTANGLNALFSNTTGSRNTATGDSTLFGNTTGNQNTATGDLALFSNTTGIQNTATGDLALFFNTIGTNNT